MSAPHVRLLALDLDGTLVKGARGVTERSRAAIRAAQDAGVAVTIATGRMFQSARRFAQSLDIHIPIICYQGAMVRHPDTGELVTSHVLPIEPALALVAYAKRHNLHVNAYVDDELYMERMTAEGRFYAETSRVDACLAKDLGAPIRRGTTKLVIVTDEDRTVDLTEELRAEFGDVLEITRSHPRFAEAIRPGVDKGTGLRVVAQAQGVPVEETMAIGDNLNDLALVRAAGLGVAMGDGDPRVRAAADWVTGAYEQEGVASAIQRLILDRSVPA